MKESIEWLSTHFFHLRVSSVDTSTFGLYPTWAVYAPSIARLLGFLSAGIIQETAQSSRSKMSVDPEHGEQSNSMYLSISRKTLQSFVIMVTCCGSQQVYLSPFCRLESSPDKGTCIWMQCSVAPMYVPN
jgi:hypothetical protein